MTTETRTFIEIDDILSIEVGCPNCKVVACYPVAIEAIKKLQSSCHHCNHQLFDMASTHVAGVDAFPALASLYQILGNLSKMANPERTDIHATIRLRLNTESKAK
jgi:hypothetical protein